MTKFQRRNARYNEIIREHSPKEYMINVEMIKEEQCQYCAKCKKDNCRLNIRDNKCINYVRKNKC